MNQHIFTNVKRGVLCPLFLAVLAISCKRLIEVPDTPPARIEQSKLFADSASAMTAVANVYSYPTSTDGGFTFNDGALTVYSALSSDEVNYTISDVNRSQFYTHTLTPDNIYIQSIWNGPYSGLYPVNAILAQVAASGGLSESFKQQITAEMKVLRALYYFYLVNRFGGVPLVLSTDYKATSVLPRTSPDSIYAQIMADLNDARQALGTSYPSAGRARPNQYTVMAFLARVHLYRENWQAAYDAANTVIESQVYHLEKDLNNVFLSGSPEAIWQLPAGYPNSNFHVNEANFFVPYAADIVPYYIVTPWLINAFEPTDQRQVKWLGANTITAGGSTQTYYYPSKYKNAFYDDPTVEDYMIFRLGEQYLIRAEAAAHLGKLDAAMADVDTIRNRAGLLPSTANATSETDVLNAIMHERQTELFCEWGHRWFDLKRTGTADAVLGAENPSWQPHEVLYPIPNSQRSLNYRLTQNPGYN